MTVNDILPFKVCSVKFGHIPVYQNYQLQWNYISKLESYNANNITCNGKEPHTYLNRNKQARDHFLW